MKNLSLRKKYALTGVCLIVAFLLVSMLLNGLLQEPFFIWQNQRKMVRITDQVEKWLKSEEDIQQNIEDLGFQENVKISVFDENYQILAATQPKWELNGRVNERMVRKLKRARQELEEKGTVFQKDEQRVNQNLSYLIQMSQAGNQGYIVVRTSIPSLMRSMVVMDIFYVISGLLTLAAGSLVIVWYSRRMVRPLEAMNQVTRQIAKLNFEEYVPVQSQDELGTLAASINSMSDQLKGSMEELQKELELRKGMTRSLAHELKTPIAVIGGYAEHLPYVAENQPEKLPRYLEVIEKECVRMDRMIREILELCAYEGWENILQPVEFSAEEFIEELAEETEEEFSRRIKTENHIGAAVYGDRQMLHRAVYNYIKNAVCHGGEDTEIVLRGRTDGESCVFSVFNSGSHIPEEEMDKIWEVFYKTDKARTRERTSCGIGLAIAREAALAHGGRSWARNLTDGVEFYLSIAGEKQKKSFSENIK